MLTIKGIYGREMYETWYKMTVMLETGLDIIAGDYASLPLHGIRERLRRDDLGQFGKSNSKLGLTGRD